MSYDYFYGQSGELFSYFRIPKALFQDHRFRQLSTDARTLYGILLDRMSLSAKNGWLDEQGRVYIIYTVREVQESLCCAEHKAVKLFRELEDMNLIERKRRGLGRPSLIYVKDFSSGLPKAQVQNTPTSQNGLRPMVSVSPNFSGRPSGALPYAPYSMCRQSMTSCSPLSGSSQPSTAGLAAISTRLPAPSTSGIAPTRLWQRNCGKRPPTLPPSSMKS